MSRTQGMGWRGLHALNGYRMFFSTGAFHKVPMRKMYMPITMRLATSVWVSWSWGGTAMALAEVSG